MSFTEQKREEIERYILRKIALDDKKFIEKAMDSFGISVTSAKRYLKKAVDEGSVVKQEDCVCGYALCEKVTEECVAIEAEGLQEDKIYDLLLREKLSVCGKAAQRIWQYVCAEMLNNALEHSRGTRIRIILRRNVLYTTVVIMDDGVGVFRTLMEYMAGHGWKEPDEEDALVELYKGKITSDAAAHSGEGIFFSSKAVDTFSIWSGGKIYRCYGGREHTVMEKRLLAYAARLQDIGTMVMMTLENETTRKLAEVFDMYADEEEGFIRTIIPVKEACISGEPVARSQARRICNRLEEFREVILDFDGVEVMGQGFADELFRVYAAAHPQVLLCPVHMNKEVRRMIRHVGRGQPADNVRLE
ncbi:MAG: DUF4325 domain-containing protein [Lachnospiraceae bacterium]|nr:DUF4325 domain-containing protein [Lachnospiraceae bacterium]